MKLAEKSFLRARQPEQIEERRQSILQAASDLFGKKGLENVSLRDIAEEAGIAKSNIYRYFESREHIYLVILQAEGLLVEEKILASLARLRGQGTTTCVARALTGAFASAEKYCLLMSVINAVLEKNLSATQITNFRIVFQERRNRIAQAVTDALPEATYNQISPLMFSIFAHVSGVWPLSHPSRDCLKLFKKPEFSHLHVDFEKETSRFINILLTGALASESTIL